MILPDLVLSNWQNRFMLETGIDSFARCVDKKHYKLYPYDVSYQYNSRGFRDDEWPESSQELKNAIWCFGDSFTVGLGSPISHTWVNMLQAATGRRCINVSMNGASNEWIARRVTQVIETINPADVVIHWSYLWRGENPDTTLSDVDRMISINLTNDVDMASNFLSLVSSLDNKFADTNIIYSCIPGFSTLNKVSAEEKWSVFKGSDWPTVPMTRKEFSLLSPNLLKELSSLDLKDKFEGFVMLNDFIDNKSKWVKEFKILDFARDYHHYDKLTSEYFVSEIMNYIRVAPV